MTINTLIFTEDEKDIKKAAEIIKNGGLVAFPTETVYGLGANAFCPEAVSDIFKAKGRPSDNPLIVHVSSKGMIDELVSEKTPVAEALIENFMPGPITVIMKKNSRVGDEVTAGLDTVAVRFPKNETARALIEFSGVPIAAPSANLSGKPSPTEARHVIADMSGRVECIIAGGACEAGVESTVVDATGDVPVILRPGIITEIDIKRAVSEVLVDENVLTPVSADKTPKSPGMKYKHYAPDADVYVVEGDKDKVKAKIYELLSENKDKKCGVLVLDDNSYSADIVFSAGKNNKEYAHNLFTRLREFDEAGAELVFAEFTEFDEYALTVKNRLYKSAGNKVIIV